MQSETEREVGAAPARLAAWLRRVSWGGGWSATRELLRWWQGELRAMVPAPLRVWGAPPLRVEATATELRLIPLPHQSPVTTLAMGDAPRPRRSGEQKRCEVVLDAALGLALPVFLPEAAEENLRRVLAFSMDRYTPFGEEEVYFDYRITQRDRARQRIELMLHVVPRPTLERVVQRLALEGIEVVSADIALREDEAGQGRAGVNLLPLTQRNRSRHQARINSVLAASALVLLLAVAIIPLYQRHQQMHKMEAALDGLRVQVRAAEQSRADVTARSETLRAIVQRRDAAPPVINVLRELTRLTPDEAWAGQVELKERRIRLTGEASAGSELLEALTASDYFVDPRFEAPLTQNPKSGLERFVLSVALKEHSDAP